MEYKGVFDEDFEEFLKTDIAKAISVENMKLIEATKRWGRDKGLTDPKAQLNKVMEELGEIAHEITRNKYEQNEALIDAFGDTLVTIIILADMLGYDVMDCLEVAYNEIANRKGKTENGTFVKEDNGEESNLQD